MHPELLNLTVRACREYMAVGDCHAKAPPTERLIATVVQLADQLSPVPDCTEPNRAVCPRLCIDFCNKAETEREFCAVRRALELACHGDKGKVAFYLSAADDDQDATPGVQVARREPSTPSPTDGSTE